MKIRDRLLMMVGSCIALILIFSLVVYVSFNRVSEENERESIAQEIGHTVSELDIVMYEYLTYREERMVQQWNSKYDVSLEIIEKVEYNELERIKTEYADLKNLFSQITTNYEKGGSPELEERLVAQFFMKSHAIIFDSSKIAKEAYDNAIEAQGTANNSMVIALIILFVALMGISFHTTRHITKPLDKLTKGAEIIGRGDLEYMIDIKNRDEIGELASSFNKMTQDLRKSNEQIKSHEKKLEQEVTERTKELDAKINELEKNRIAILNMMEDSEEANRRLLQTQEELKKALDEIKKMDVKKDEFISITAHELKTPLTAIHGFADLLQDGKIDVESRQKYLKIMTEETKRLAKLVTEILDLSRIDLGTFKFNFENADLRQVVDDIRNEIKIPAKQKNLETRYLISPNVPKIIVTDPESLRQILINLMINAVKYTPKGRIELKVSKEGENLKFSVKDTGIGIAKENIPKLFQRFYQIDSSYTRVVRGSGLGLALCKELVEGMGGRIWLESKVGKGSTFHFTLPLKSDSAKGVI